MCRRRPRPSRPRRSGRRSGGSRTRAARRRRSGPTPPSGTAPAPRRAARRTSCARWSSSLRHAASCLLASRCPGEADALARAAPSCAPCAIRCSAAAAAPPPLFCPSGSARTAACSWFSTVRMPLPMQSPVQPQQRQPRASCRCRPCRNAWSRRGSRSRAPRSRRSSPCRWAMPIAVGISSAPGTSTVSCVAPAAFRASRRAPDSSSSAMSR